jgi:hypothetical protein
MTAAQDVLDAIKAFEKEHGRDPKFRHVFSALADVEDGLSRLVRQGEVEDSPGKQAARQAAKEAEDRASNREEPKAEKPAEKPAEDDQPKSFAAAREKAKERLSKPEESDAEGSEAEPVAA